MFQKIQIQLHLWPWSVGVPHETIDITQEKITFPFYGSPVISALTETKLFLPSRYERFISLGPEYKTAEGVYRLYEAPHGLLADRKSENSGAIIHASSIRGTVFFEAKGAIGQKGIDGDENIGEKLKSVVLGWSQFFDDMLEEAEQRWHRQNKFPWSNVLEFLEIVRDQKESPRMALIVRIAQEMHRKLPQIVTALRKVLVRERKLMSVDRISETDVCCLLWYIRQPGNTMVEKAGYRQELLGVSRRESFNTHENRIVKDFLSRCIIEAARYIKTEILPNPVYEKSDRAVQVRTFKNICAVLKREQIFEQILTPVAGSSPNYVLQNDYRYREIWKWYQKLLKREDEEDKYWDWQARGWADVCRFLVCAALWKLTLPEENFKRKFIFKELLRSVLHIFQEQRAGCKISPDSMPGPMVILNVQGTRKKPIAVIEVVHSDYAGKHSYARYLGRTGGHLYLVLRPINGSGVRPRIIIVWGVHTSGSFQVPSWTDIGASARQAIKRHEIIISDSYSDFPRLSGIVVASDLQAKEADAYLSTPESLPIIQVPADYRQWEDAIIFLQLVLEELLESML